MLGCNAGRSLWWLNIKGKSKTRAKFTANIYPLAASLPFSLLSTADNDILYLLTSLALLSLRRENNKSHKLSPIVLTKYSPLGLKVEPPVPAVLCPSSLSHLKTRESTFELSPHVHVMQLLAQLLKDISTSKCPCKLCSLLLCFKFPLIVMTQISCGQSHTPVIVVHVYLNNSFTVISLLFVSHSHLYLSCVSPPALPRREIKGK